MPCRSGIDSDGWRVSAFAISIDNVLERVSSLKPTNTSQTRLWQFFSACLRLYCLTKRQNYEVICCGINLDMDLRSGKCPHIEWVWSSYRIRLEFYCQDTWTLEIVSDRKLACISDSWVLQRLLLNLIRMRPYENRAPTIRECESIHRHRQAGRKGLVCFYIL